MSHELSSMNDLSLIMDRLFIPKQGLTPKSERTYRIDMVNSYINHCGQVYKRQILNSTYTRIVREITEDAIAFLGHRWDKVTFINRVPKMPVTPVDWTFIQGKTFNTFLVFSNERCEQIWLRAKDKNENPWECFRYIEEEYAEYPKLPATYLVIMQTMDIMGFESYMSYIHTHAYTNKGWKMDEWELIQIPEREQGGEAKIGFGLYAENSTFKNGKFYLKLTGYGKANNKICAIFDYYCDNSRVKMQEKERSHIQRNGTSYYHGQIWIGLDNGDVERGTMLESYIALQEGDQKTPVHIRRKILCESVSDPQQ
jgi:hypothetical protein